MKIAIATEGTEVSEHFGKCENFTMAEIVNSDVKDRVIVNTGGNQHGLLPAFLASHNVDVVIAGGMGEGAQQKLLSSGIKIISGVSGNIEETISAYLKGDLKSNGAGCSGHDHSHGHSGDHEQGHSHGENGCSCGRH